ECEAAADDFGRERPRVEVRERGSPRGRSGCGARPFDGALEVAGAQLDLDVARRRAGNCQHQGGGVAEVFPELDWAGTARQVVDPVELQLDVIELLARVL